MLISAPRPLLALVNAEFAYSPKSWLHTIRDDLMWLRASHHKFKEFPLPSAGMDPWMDEIR
eukprot:9186613-Pyramimonas_sp.AAC.1